MWSAHPVLVDITVPPNVGWALVLLGPVLAVLAFFAVRSRRGKKLGVGAAACVGLLWFVATADWLPPGWAAFWSSHSISAGFVTSLLGVAAGWTFLDERVAMRRRTALHVTWRRWLESQSEFLTAIILDPPKLADSVVAQRARASDLRSRLLVQQQWTATMFTIAALRTDDGGIELLPALGKLRDVGADAIREFARLEAVLESVNGEHLTLEAIDALWKRPLFQVQRLVDNLGKIRTSLRDSHWAAQAGTGQAPTHPISDLDSMPVRVTSWSK